MAAGMSHIGDRALSRRRRGGRVAPPKPGRLAIPGTRERQPFAINDVTPEQAVRMLRTAAYGDLAELDALYDNMFEHDGHMFSVSDSRRLALTGLTEKMLPAAETNQIPKDKQKQADETADFCKQRLSQIEGLRAFLGHMQQSVDRGLRITEVEWDTCPDGVYAPCRFHPLLPSQIKQDPETPGRILIVTPDNDQGVPLDEQTEGKFIVLHRYTRRNNPFVSGLMLMALMWHMYTRWGMRWWGSGLERFGLPILIAEYLQDATDEEKDEILDILENMGANGVGIIRKGTEFQMHHAAMSGRWPHQHLMQFADAQKSKLWLGATLTVEQGDVGSHALGQEHQEVKRDRLEEDIILESEMMGQLLGPMVRYAFGPDAWVPCFRRVIEDAKDLADTATWLSSVMSSTGVKPTVGWVVNMFGIEVPKGTELKDPVPGGSFVGSAFAGGVPHSERHAAACVCGDEVVTPHRALETIASRKRTAIAKILPWVFTAVLASRAHTENVFGAIQEAIAPAGDLSTVLHGLPDTFDRLPIDDVVELNSQFLLATHLAGMNQSPRRVTAHAEGRIDFDRLPYLEAIEALRERLGLDPETNLELDAAARSRAWRVAGVWNMQLLSSVHRELIDAIETGETSRDFRLRVPAMAEAGGWSGPNPWHADLVYYQNAVMAYGAGHYRQSIEFGVRAWRFVGRGDSCPICEPEIGKVYPIEDVDRMPPLHFWCDCEREDVFDDEPLEGELTSSADVENEALVQARSKRSGFKWDPRQYADLEPVNLSEFPEELQSAFEAFARTHGWEIAA